jgi:hypothetical protein
MISRIIASLVGAAMMVTSAAAQDYPDDDYMPPDAVPMRRMQQDDGIPVGRMQTDDDGVQVRHMQPDDGIPMRRIQAEDGVPVSRIQGGNCQRAVQQALQMTGGELLSVRPARNGKPVCAVTVLVITAKGRPRKVRLRVPMDF